MRDRDAYVIAEALIIAIEALSALPPQLRREGKAKEMKRIFETLAPNQLDDLQLDLIQRDTRQLLYALKYGRLPPDA
jgi:hypothetical protein